MGDRNDLYLFFDRPMEPCFMQKGEDKAVFDLPHHFYPDQYKDMSSELSERFGCDCGRKIPVQDISLPDLSVPMQLPYNEHFSLFVPKHRKLSARLIEIFMGCRDVEELKSVCSYCQLRINPYLFNYCLSVAMLHRPDTKGMAIPTLVETFPDKFMDRKVFRKARQVSTTSPTGTRLPILIPMSYTAADSEPEQKLAYFREDIGVNLHHWHWHLVNPFDAPDISIVNKDRRGELFYYMHQQMVGRYSIERLCNDLGKIIRFSDLREPITEGYFPKMESSVASRTWPPRSPGTRISDVNRPADLIRLDVTQVEDWRERYLNAIETGRVMFPDGETMLLDEITGIDILGNMMESSIISVNRNFYGDFHNMGHMFISYCHDPDNRHLESFGIMAESTVAMRDPVFYRWHSYIDDIFVMYKKKLPPYGTHVLDFPGIRVSSISVEGVGGMNSFSTFWEQSTLELGRGLDFTPRGSVLATFTHLQHEEFEYIIEVNNASGKAVMGMFRIFMAPVFDENGQEYPFSEQRRFMIEMDKFNQPLSSGLNTIRQSSISSSVTTPYERTFINQADRLGPAGSPDAAQFDFCVCGWPHHMLIPKGTIKGYPVVLFVMVSNWDDDKVEQDLVGTCNEAPAYCGLKDRRYPDKRAMGFPFDRLGQPFVDNLSDFLMPNMATQDCTIRFTNETRQRPQRR